MIFMVTTALRTSRVPTAVSHQRRTLTRSSIQTLHALPDSVIFPIFQQGFAVNTVLGSALYFSKQKSLTKPGLLHSYLLGVGLWTFLGWQGWLVCVSYLILGSIVTKVKMLEKERLGIAEKRGGARGPENVWGSAATAMICAILSYLLPESYHIFSVGYAASLATKLSDTFASEIGKAYGKTTYLITTLQRVPRGTEGAVSLEGTLAGVVGSGLITGLAAALNIIHVQDILPCLVAAFIGNTIESYIGAIYQDNVSWMTNEFVNFINTSIGAIVAIVIVTSLH